VVTLWRGDELLEAEAWDIGFAASRSPTACCA
jgi:hypothetical protein